MKITCAPSQVMREGRDLNQHGQAGRHEQASSSSPVTFHGALSDAPAPFAGRANVVIQHTIAIGSVNFWEVMAFISFPFIELLRLLSRILAPGNEWSTVKATVALWGLRGSADIF